MPPILSKRERLFRAFLSHKEPDHDAFADCLGATTTDLLLLTRIQSKILIRSWGDVGAAARSVCAGYNGQNGVGASHRPASGAFYCELCWSTENPECSCCDNDKNGASSPHDDTMFS